MTKNKGDLISREALRKEVKVLLDLAVKRVNDTPNNSPCYRMYVEQENERARLVYLIDNAPTVEITDYDTGYQDGLEDGLNDIRPQGEWQVKDNLREGFYICSNCGEISCCKGNFCPDCGADMRGDKQ